MSLNKKNKKLGLLAIIIGSVIKLLFFSPKQTKLHQNIPQYNPEPSDKDYVEIDITQNDVTSENNQIIRSPDGSA